MEDDKIKDPIEALYDPKRRFKLWKSSLDQGKMV